MIGGAKGIGIGLDFGIGNIKRPTKRDTLDPAIKEALCGIWIADQNTNESPTRNIIKNKIANAGGDFEILNAAYSGNSGYGIGEVFPFVENNAGNSNKDWLGQNLKYQVLNNNTVRILNVEKSNALFYAPTTTNKSYYKIKGISSNKPIVFKGIYSIWEGISVKEDGIYEVDWALNVNASGQAQRINILIDGWVGDCDIVIEQIKNHQGAFVTDGVDDLIVSQKKMSEILNGSNEATVISMIANLDSEQILCNSNFSNTNAYNVRNTLEPNGVISMLGYTDKNGTTTNLNLIMGDKNSIKLTDKVNFNSDYVFYPAQYYKTYYQAAWYWTLIAKRVLTTDEINQVIAYYNLDKYVTPDIYYDVKKQGLTNENHAEFGDKLIDYSGNGKDMQLYNFGWKLDSGVGKYEVDFAYYFTNNTNKYDTITSNILKANSTASVPQSLLFRYINKDEVDKDLPEYDIKVDNLIGGINYRYFDSNGVIQVFSIRANGRYTLPKSFLTHTSKLEWYGFTIEPNSSVIIEQLPSFEGALVFDGVDDYGQYVGDLGLKDYTVVADRAYVELLTIQVPIVSNINKGIDTPFIFEYSTMLSDNKSCSYGVNTVINKKINANKEISYQSTYVYNRTPISRGTSTNTGNGLTFGRYGGDAQYTKLCLYNFMLFPYSLSEFLIERQLKKRKIGTLYLGMIKFNPIVDSNAKYNVIDYYIDNMPAIIGNYYPIDSKLRIAITTVDSDDKVTSLSVNKVSFGTPTAVDNRFTFNGTLSNKSPQVISIVIDGYVKYENIVQPYPAYLIIQDKHTNQEYSWGDKIKKGTVLKVKDIKVLFSELYKINAYVYENKELGYAGMISKEFVAGKDDLEFSVIKEYKLGANPPKVIYSPERYPMPNGSLKMLGYIPDLSGNGNNGKLNSFSFTGNFDVISDGAIQFMKPINGYSHITIPTIKDGCKQVMVKIKWIIKDKMSYGYIYDHSGGSPKYDNAIYIRENADEDIAYMGNIKTYLNGKLNTSIKTKTLAGITHNITSILNSDSAKEIYIGKNGKNVMANDELRGGIYTIMLFDDIDNDETIMKLNDILNK